MNLQQQAPLLVLLLLVTHTLTIFRRSGTIATDVTAYNIIGRIPLTETLRQHTEVNQWINQLKQLWNDVKDQESLGPDFIHSQLRLIQEKRRAINRTFTDLLELSHSHQPRPKRSLLVLAGLATLGTTITSLLYSRTLAWELEHNQAQVKHLAQNLQMLDHQVHTNTRRVQLLKDTVTNLVRRQIVSQDQTEQLHTMQRAIMDIDTTYRALNEYADSSQTLLDTIVQAFQGRVSTTLITPSQVLTTLKKIASELPNDLQIAFPIHQPEIFYTLPAHAVMVNNEMQVVIPIPIFNIKETLELHRYTPTPIIRNAHLEVLTQSATEYLATNHEGTLYQELSANDLIDCLHIAELKLCPALRVQKKTTKDSCLLGLYRGNLPQALAHCQHHVRATTPLDLTLLQTNEILATAAHDTTIQQECTTPEQNAQLHIPPGHTTLTIPHGCSLSSENLYVAPLRNETISADAFTIRLPHWTNFTLSQLLHAKGIPLSSLPELEQQVAALNTPGDTLPLDDWKPKTNPQTSPPNTYWPITATLLTCNVGLIAINGYLWIRSGRAFKKGGLCNGSRLYETPIELQ